MDDKQDKRIKKLREQVENNSKELQEIIDGIIKPYTEELDNYVEWVKSMVTNYENPPTSIELDDMTMTLSVLIYSASGMQEQLGIRDDIAKALYKEMYHSARDNLDKGTVADKNSLAELATQEEALVSMLYKRAYNTVKAKVSAAQEILASIKKIVSRRMAEMELTRLT